MAIVTTTTLGMLRERVSRRLNDSGHIFWHKEELDDYINEALFTFQSLSQYRVKQINKTITAGTWFLDLNNEIPNGYIDADIEMAVRDVLFEMADTEQFDNFTNLFNSALSKVRRNFQNATALTVNYRVLNGNSGFIDLGVDHIRPIHVEWKGSGSGRYRRLNPESFDSKIFNNYPNLGTPIGYIVNPDENKRLELLPHPDSLGDIHLFEISTSANIPPNVRWILKYMVLDQFFNTDGQARDLVRGQYTKKRIEDGLQIANNLPLYRGSYANESPLWLTSLADLSSQETQWRALTGRCYTIATVGWNYLIFHKIPTVDFSLMINIVEQLELLVNDSDLLPFPEEFDTTIEDYVVHLAMLKVSGAEFQATFPFYEQLIKKASEYNRKLLPLVPYLGIELGNSNREKADRPQEAKGND